MLLLLKGDLLNIINLSLDKGEVIMFFAVICWSIYSILLQYVDKRITPIQLLYVTALIGTVISFCLYGYDLYQAHYVLITVHSMFSLLYIVIFASILSYMCWASGMETIGPEKGAQFINLVPIFGAIFGAIFLGESF